MKLSKALCKAISQVIIKFDINEPLYVPLILLNLAQTIICVLHPESPIFDILKWFDISFVFDVIILFYVVFVPTLLCGFSIFLQIYWSFQEEEGLSKKFMQHYTIKITSALCFILSHTQFLTIIRCSIELILSSDLVLNILGVSLLVIFCIVYTFSMFLVTDMSPQNQRVYSSLSFPNYLTFINIYRPVAALLVSFGLYVFALIPTCALLLVMAGFLWKSPICSWRFNNAIIVYVGVLVWAIVYRVVSICSGEEMSIGTFFIGIPVFVVSAKWFVSKRVEAITLNPENSVVKLKLLYYMLLNREIYDNELNIFLVKHCKHCEIETCSCQKLLAEIHPKKGERKTIREAASNMMDDACKPEFISEEISETKKAVEKEFEIEDRPIKGSLKGEKRLWFQLLLDLQNEKFSIEKLRQLPPSEMEALIKQIRSVLFDQVEVLHYQLDKQYQSLRCFWFVKGESADRLPLFMRVRSLIEQARQEETIERKSKEEGSNVYTLNYYELQIRMLEFKRVLLDICLRAKSFWTQFLSEKPDQKKVSFLLQQLLDSRMEFLKSKQELMINWLGNSSNDFQLQWNSKIKAILEEMTERFEKVIQSSQIKIPNMEMNMTKASPKNQDHQCQHFDKKLQFYDVKSITAMGVVSVKDGEDFGQIVNSNREFWRLMGYERYEKPHINHFLIEEMHDYHNRTIVNFLNQNKHVTKFHRGFVINSQSIIMEIQFSIQLLPHLAEGLYAAAFFQQICAPSPIIVINECCKILSYNYLFSQEYLHNQTTDYYEQMLTKKMIKEIINESEKILTTSNDLQIHLKLCHQVPGETEKQRLYFCEIFIDWKEPPSILQRKTQKTVFYAGKNQILERKQTLLKNEAHKKQKKYHEEEQEVDYDHLLNGLIKTKIGWNLKFWKITMYFSLLIILTLAGTCAGFSEVRRQAFANSLNQQRNVTRMLQWIAEMAFLARKVNIMSFNGEPAEEVQIYGNKSFQLTKEIKNQLRIMPTSIWNTTFFYYELYYNDNMNMNKTIIEMVLERYILSSCATYLLADYASHAFDYIHELNPIPLSSIYTNFMNLIQNTYYVYIPRVKKDFRQLLDQIIKNRIIIPIPIVPLVSVILIVGIFIQVFTTIFRCKMRQAIIRSLMILEKIEPKNLKERIQSIEMYNSIFLKEVMTEKQSQSCPLKYFDEQNQIRKKISISDLTHRTLSIRNKDKDELKTQEQIQIQMNLQINKDDQNVKVLRMVEKRQSLFTMASNKRQMFINGSFGMFPILILSILIISYQISINFQVWSLLNLRECHSKKLENILLLNSLSFEFGLETQYFRSNSESMTNQLDSIFVEIYENNRKLRDSEAEIDPKFTAYSRSIRYTDLCDAIDKIDNPQKKCEQHERVIYEGRTMDQVFVDFIQTARILYLDYKSKPFTIENQRAFSSDPRHKDIESMSDFLRVIQYSISVQFDKKFEQFNKNYQVIIASLCTFAMFITIIIHKLWLMIQLKNVIFDQEMTKTVFWLIKGSQLQKNDKLKKQMKEQIKYFTIMQ